MNRTAARRHPLLCALFVLLLFAASSIVAAHAQTGIYGEFGASRVNLPTDDWAYGGTFGLYSDFAKLPLVRAGGDVRVQFTRLANDTTLTSFLLGPRVAVHPHVVPFTPYVEGLIGGGHFSYGNNSPSTTQFDWRVLGGIDRTVVPHLDWRIVEVSYGDIGTYSGHLKPVTISTGIVLRLH
jgi:hypothetical protein